MQHTSNTVPSAVRRVGAICLLLNCMLAGVKICGGLAGNSQSVVADGVHTLTDALSDIALITGTLFWSRPPDRCHPYGHRRIETLISAAIAVLLLLTAVSIGWQALVRLHGGPQPPPGLIAFAAALLSIIVKEIMYRWSQAAGRRLKSPALSANAWHQRTDALTSIPVAVAVAANALMPSLWFLDSVAALLVSLLIIKAAGTICFPALRELIDKGAEAQVTAHISNHARAIAGVRQVHAVRTRYVAGTMLVDLHIMVDPELSVRAAHAIAHAVESRLLNSGPDIVDVLVHIEPHEEQHDSP